MRLAIIGVGNLGGSLAERLLVSGFCRDDLSLITRGSEASLRRCEKLGLEPEKIRNIGVFDTIVLAVKPQDSEAVCAELKSFLHTDALIISLMAGVPTSNISEFLNRLSVVRAMPNLGTVVGQSATAYFVLNEISELQRNNLKHVLNACGQTFEVFDEGLLDVATAVAGSGPAYLCWLGEQIESVALAEGFSKEEAHSIVLQTFKGAVAYLEHGGESFSELRAKVTSPQGTTAAAIQTLDGALAHETVQSAIKAALDRAREFRNHFS
jgi:pyrroline-5-carboxylate reductase